MSDQHQPQQSQQPYVQQPDHGYGQQPPPGYYPPQQPPKKSHTLRNVLLVVGLLLILLVGGCIAVVGLAANEVGKSIDEASKADKAPGGPDNPLKITPGKPFEVSGFNYAAGWSVTGGPVGLDIKGLKVTNNRDSKDGAIVEIKFMKANEILASADCTSGQLSPGQTATVKCLSGDDLPKNYDRITINDSF